MTFDDLEWTQPPVSRSPYSLKANILQRVHVMAGNMTLCGFISNSWFGTSFTSVLQYMYLKVNWNISSAFCFAAIHEAFVWDVTIFIMIMSAMGMVCSVSNIHIFFHCQVHEKYLQKWTSNLIRLNGTNHCSCSKNASGFDNFSSIRKP